jgi:valyl-tRNA synthetase
VLETLLRLLHPIIPFITEEIWQKVAPIAKVQGKSIMTQHYPSYDASLCNQQTEHDITWLKDIIVGIRTIRAEMNIAPNKPLPVLLHQGSADDAKRLQTYENLLMRLAKLASIQWLKESDAVPDAASALVGQMKVLIPLAGLIDVAAETARLQKELTKLQRDYQQVSNKLGNTNFITNAPEDVVILQKERAVELQQKITAITQQINTLN